MPPDRSIRAAGRRSRLLVRAVNHAAGAVSRVRGPTRLDLDELHQRATDQADLDDFGSEEYREPLAVLVESLELDARLTAAGRFFARGALVDALVNRLRLQSDWSQFPEIQEVRIEAPTFIVGLPRTGTTLLQNLMSLDGRRRNLLGWEAARPSPPPTAETYDSDPRIAAAARTTKLLDYLAPEARRLHPVAPTMPTECVTLFVNSFASLETATIHQVWRYVDWCLAADYTSHYDYYADQLRLLQWRNDRGRWVLKSPAHLFWLDQIVRLFPDARIIQTHRDPVEAVTSFCSLAAVLQRIGSDDIDTARLGQVWPPVWREGLDRATAARRASSIDVFDCHYDVLVGDPVGAVRSIYEHFGDECTPEFEQAMHTWLASHPQHAGGVHRYDVTDFGLDRAEEDERFRTYRERYGVAPSR